MNPEKYHYRTLHSSLIGPIFDQYVAAPVSKVLPRVLPAIWVALVAHLLLYLPLYLAYRQDASRPFPFVLISVVVLLHGLFRRMIWLHAYRTCTASPLLEFMYHSLNVVSNTFIMLIMVRLFHLDNPWLLAVLMTVSFLTQAVVSYGQLRTSWRYRFYFDHLEFIFFMSVLILLAHFDAVEAFYLMKVWRGLSWISLLMVVVSFFAVVYFLVMIGRVRPVSYGFWFFCVLLFATGYLSAHLLDAMEVVYVLGLYAMAYILKVMQGFFLDGLERSPGFFVPLLLSLAFYLDIIREMPVAFIIIFYLCANIFLAAFKVWKVLKKDWIWYNGKKGL